MACDLAKLLGKRANVQTCLECRAFFLLFRCNYVSLKDDMSVSPDRLLRMVSEKKDNKINVYTLHSIRILGAPQAMVFVSLLLSARRFPIKNLAMK